MTTHWFVILMMIYIVINLLLITILKKGAIWIHLYYCSRNLAALPLHKYCYCWYNFMKDILWFLNLYLLWFKNLVNCLKHLWSNSSKFLRNTVEILFYILIFLMNLFSLHAFNSYNICVGRTFQTSLNICYKIQISNFL